MRKQITLYDDMYQFYKDTKSKRLLIAFVEYLFEWIEPTDLKWIENTIFNSLKIRMENQWKKSFAWTQSHWWWRQSKKQKNESNTNSELDHKNNTKTTEQTTKETTKKQEDNNTNVLLLSNSVLFRIYYWASKWIDEWKCNKLIDWLLKKWITLEELKQSIVLYNSECRLRDDWYQFAKKFDNRLKEYWNPTREQMEEELYRVIKQYKLRKKNDDKRWKSEKSKTLRNELCEAFWKDNVNAIFKSIDLNTNMLHFN